MEAGKRALDLSMKAIDAYKKTLLVDKVTSDDERAPPVYILDEISNILMSCSLELTKEIVEYTFQRLRHRSPYVKKKVLKFIKYTVIKAGSSSYRRELQSHSITIRELLNYQGQVDPLKGNAPSQGVRDAAQETIKAIFSSDASFNSKYIRVEGFGNGSFSKPSKTVYRNSGYEERGRESFLCCKSNGSFDYCDSNENFENRNSYSRFGDQNNDDDDGGAINVDSGNCEQDKKGATLNDEQSQGRNFCTKSENVIFLEDRLLNNVTTSIGSRIRPTEENLQSFLSSAKTLNAVRISDALKRKLQSSSWQVRLKVLCVLKAILLQKDANLLQGVETYERDFDGLVQKCLQSAQTTLRREAKEMQVFDILSALKEEKFRGRADDGLVKDPSCDKPFFTMEEVDNEVHNCADLACGQTADTSPNSTMDDPFDGMCIYGLNYDKAAMHVKDLLFDGGVSAHTETPFDSPNNM
ncbi:hypothetical protein GOP47_0006119 [Adiantum capillus-veneris]|uniref:ENTH domain-containing protein n=1 Tax=Adiantum capillus-veneris TaxID=13818 RepID=A0A9D4V2G6_ADICA|nr:hypothetical protein GOP47_0006119 [Adiantum capillus-veneris]